MVDELIITAFEAIGIPKMQTIVYLDLLKNNKSSAAQIAKRTGLHRTNVYDILTKLKERNLVFLSYTEGKQAYAALTTDLILNQQKERLEQLESAMKYINTTYVSGQTPRVYTLEGLSAVRSIMLGLLEKKSPIWVYGIVENEDMINMLNAKIMHAFQMERVKREIELKMLFYKATVGEKNLLGKLKYTEARLLPKTQQAKSSQMTQVVCGDSVYITLWIEPIHTIVIENDLIAKEYLEFYNILWNYSKKIE